MFMESPNDILIVALLVDDLVIIGNNVNLILGLRKKLVDTFEMDDLGLLHFFSGIQILQKDNGTFVSQLKYVLNLLLRLNREYCNPYASPYQMRSDD